eukprot:scaffold74481_cov47-Prasinocladus_malaysianus.AAC.1
MKRRTRTEVAQASQDEPGSVRTMYMAFFTAAALPRQLRRAPCVPESGTSSSLASMSVLSELQHLNAGGTICGCLWLWW